ncbi:unnamed protein product [Meganyctiphanes norvegica]|uniref:Uncharacterized protein n=1 Tax=Meganyctiphanes norvegica TaxID=48144 RepID=A0AAV2RTZ1_MEGNR
MDAMLKHLLHSLDEGQCISKDITKMLVPMPELEKSIEIYLSMMKDQLLHLQPEDWPEYVGRSLTLVKEFKNKKRYRSELQNRNEQQQQKDEPQCSNEQLHKDEQKLLAQCPGAIQMHQYQPAQQPVHIYVHTKI